MNKKGMVQRKHSQEKEMDLQPRKMMVQTPRIITKEEEYKWSLPQDMASYAHDNSEKYIPEKDVKEEIALSRGRLTLSRKTK